MADRRTVIADNDVLSASTPPSPAVAIGPSIDPSDQSKHLEAPPDVQSQTSGDSGTPATTTSRGKKPAWKRTPASLSAEIGAGAAVMGAASWPALSESAKASPKSLTSDSPNPASSEGLVSSPATTGIVDQNLGPDVTLNSVGSQPSAPVHERSMKRGGGSGGGGSSGALANGGLDPAALVADGQGALRNSPREHAARSPVGGWDQRARGGGRTGWQGHGGGENHRGHGGNHRGNNGGGGDRNPHRGNSERGGFDGYHPRGFRGRNSHVPQRGAGPLVRPHAQHVSHATYFAPSPTVRAYGNLPLGYPELVSSMPHIAPQLPPSEAFMSMPFLPYSVQPPPVLIAPIGPHQAAILQQIDYYFSAENLCKDMYLRDHMDEQGWVPISVVAGFNKVKQLTDNINYILETVRFSTVVEVQGENVRRRGDWMKWVLPSKSSHYTAGTPGFTGQGDAL